MKPGLVGYVAGATLLAAVAGWCAWVVLSVGDLRHELERDVGALRALDGLRDAVADHDRPASAWRGPAEEAAQVRDVVSGSAPDAAGDANALAQALEAAANGAAAPDMRTADLTIDHLSTALRQRDRALSIALGNRWQYLYGVVVVVIVLATCLFALVVLGERRRRRAEASEASLRERNETLRRAAREWASGDLTAPLPPRAGTHDDFERALDALRVALSKNVEALTAKHREAAVLAEDLRAQIRRTTEELAAALARPAAASEPGAVIDDRFQLLELLGRGGMGTVYRARRIEDGRPVALKLMRNPADDTQRQRFLREARLLSEVEHPNVMRILDVGVSDGQLLLVTELIEGSNLSNLADLELEPSLEILRAVAAGLAAIHARGIVHRDLKPSNVVVGRGADGPIVKIVDFGIARLAQIDEPSATPEPTADEDGPTASTVTAAPPEVTGKHLLVGTLRYMAPECAIPGTVTAAADVFSFGVVAFRLLFGHFPWPRPPIEMVRSTGKLPAPVINDPHVPLEVNALILRCLAESSDLRPSSQELAASL